MADPLVVWFDLRLCIQSNFEAEKHYIIPIIFLRLLFFYAEL